MSAAQKQFDVIAIDGGAASGKSTAARATAKALGYVHVDSGALYRSAGWMLSKSGIDLSNRAAVLKVLPRLRVVAEVREGRMRIRADGDEPQDAQLRTAEVAVAASAVAVLPEVRALVNAQLRALASQANVVVEGRDIGTAVFPNARAKFYLTASPEERAKRRQQELAAMTAQQASDVEKVKADLAKRDHKDSSRDVDPLRAAPDAVVIDTTHNTIEQTAATILEHIRRKESGAPAK